MKHHAKIHTLLNGTLCFFVPTQDGEDKYLLGNIICLKGESNQTRLFVIDENKKVSEKVIDGSLNYWGVPMMKHGFAQPHHSWIINLIYFIHYQKGRLGWVQLTYKDGTVPVSEGYRKSFLCTLNDETYTPGERQEEDIPDKNLNFPLDTSA
jgi:DNA-binding LytR/AlgR family response regulator